MVVAPCFGGLRALDQVHLGRADEARDEQVARAVDRGPAACRPARSRPALQHHDLVGQRHRLDLVVGDVDHRRRRAPGAARRSRAASARAARRRGSTAARRTGRPSGSRTMARPIATRWRWPPDSWPGRAVEVVGRGCRMPRRVRDLLVDRRLRHRRAILSGKAMFSPHRHVRIERVGLEHHREAALGRRPRR